MPVGEAGFEERFAGADPGIVHQNVQTTEFAQHGVDHASPALLVASVVGKAHMPESGRRHFSGDGARALPFDVRGDYASPFAREGQGSCSPDPCGCARDDRDFTGDAIHDQVTVNPPSIVKIAPCR